MSIVHFMNYTYVHILYLCVSAKYGIWSKLTEYKNLLQTRDKISFMDRDLDLTG